MTNECTTLYSYDPLNRMTSRDKISYSYNGDGVLVTQLANGTTTSYAQDLASPLSQVLQTTQGSATTNYLYGATRLASLSGSTRTWYATDPWEPAPHAHRQRHAARHRELRPVGTPRPNAAA